VENAKPINLTNVRNYTSEWLPCQDWRLLWQQTCERSGAVAGNRSLCYNPPQGDWTRRYCAASP
jgi:hypothetical protein